MGSEVLPAMRQPQSPASRGFANTLLSFDHTQFLLARRSQHYVDWVDDQFDFHSYCLRKMTVNAYVDLLRFVDNLHARSMYEKAALAMIECYLYGPPCRPSLR